MIANYYYIVQMEELLWLIIQVCSIKKLVPRTKVYQKSKVLRKSTECPPKQMSNKTVVFRGKKIFNNVKTLVHIAI